MIIILLLKKISRKINTISMIIKLIQFIINYWYTKNVQAYKDFLSF